MLHGRIMLNSQELPRFWGLHMEGKSLHMADFGLLGRFLVYTQFAYRNNHQLNVVKLSKKNVEINLPKILDALKYFVSTKTIAMTTLGLQ